MTISLAASLVIRQARKASKSRNIETGQLGRPMYLTEAVLYRKVKNEGTESEYEKLMLRGVDAVTGLSVTGIEYHGPEFSGSLKNTIFSNFYTTTWKQPDTGFQMEFKHVGAPVPGIDESIFDELVSSAQEAFGSNETDDQGDAPVA
jgi:hypothetical protein